MDYLPESTVAWQNMTVQIMADATPTEDDDRAEVRRRQWDIVEKLRRQGDPTAKEIADAIEKILREIEVEDQHKA
ncbi:MAG: hypothetical protein L0Y44_00940 [Phycisphaerales bacterium]|nr:hypothetical protein [Phycisphaerales bacterium]MCI0674446.1 hypothetical protein [Phycisphaerales bacterium]